MRVIDPGAQIVRLEADLLEQFAARGVQGTFAGVDLSAWDLPEARGQLARRALGQQDAPLGSAHDAHGHLDTVAQHGGVNLSRARHAGRRNRQRARLHPTGAGWS